MSRAIASLIRVVLQEIFPSVAFSWNILLMRHIQLNVLSRLWPDQIPAYCNRNLCNVR